MGVRTLSRRQVLVGAGGFGLGLPILQSILPRELRAQGSPMPTIDQLMAWSESFYGDLAGITQRSLVFGGNRLSYNWSSPSDRSGDIQEVSGSNDPLAMFNRVFIPEEAPNQPAPRPAIVDRVFTSFQSLRQSNRRLSTEDKQRLDDHMDRLAELQRRLGTNIVRRSSCGDAIEPMGSGSTAVERYSLINDVIVTAFLCGTSRIAIVKVSETSFTDYAGDWHQDIAHQHTDPEPQARLREVTQKVFEHALLDLAHKLDVEEAPGETILNSALVQWTQESGEITHDNRSVPTITFGGARGALNTGLYCDYRKRTEEGFASDEWGGSLGYSGLLYSQWLATIMQLMGLDPSEFQPIEHNGQNGYGYPHIGDHYLSVQSEGVEANASDILPFLGT